MYVSGTVSRTPKLFKVIIENNLILHGSVTRRALSSHGRDGVSNRLWSYGHGPTGTSPVMSRATKPILGPRKPTPRSSEWTQPQCPRYDQCPRPLCRPYPWGDTVEGEHRASCPKCLDRAHRSPCTCLEVGPPTAPFGTGPPTLGLESVLVTWTSRSSLSPSLLRVRGTCTKGGFGRTSVYLVRVHIFPSDR